MCCHTGRNNKHRDNTGTKQKIHDITDYKHKRIVTYNDDDGDIY